jgi:hypothetical protein
VVAALTLWSAPAEFLTHLSEIFDTAPSAPEERGMAFENVRKI